jgi:hypothetical protein
MVSSTPEPLSPAVTPAPASVGSALSTEIDTPTPEVSTEISHDTRLGASSRPDNGSSFNEALNSVLPQPVDASQPVVPANLLPPAATALAEPADPTSSIADTSVQANTVGSEADKILSEIDDIYSSQPFDPANNPRSDLGANPVTLDQDVEDEPLPSSVLAVDTSVQQDQANTSNLANAAPINQTNPSLTGLPAIPDAKQETITSSDLLGDAPAANKPDSVVPGIQMPSVNVPPPPPPPPIEGVPTFTPTIDFSEAQKE